MDPFLLGYQNWVDENPVLLIEDPIIGILYMYYKVWNRPRILLKHSFFFQPSYCVCKNVEEQLKKSMTFDFFVVERSLCEMKITSVVLCIIGGNLYCLIGIALFSSNYLGFSVTAIEKAPIGLFGNVVTARILLNTKIY